MIREADVVVIGSGGLGAATAYYLAKRGGLSVALLDKHDSGSQTSPRAAGMVSCMRKGELMIELIKDACRKIETFTVETDQPLDWVHSGSLKIARRPQDADVIAADLDRGRRMGLDVEQVSPEEAHRLNPFLKPSGVVAALRIGDDRYFDPAQVAIGFTRAAAAKGRPCRRERMSPKFASRVARLPACKPATGRYKQRLWSMPPALGRGRWRRPAAFASRWCPRVSS
jgi:glycine/D-amino acid oxidase-like deaminating enzyme